METVEQLESEVQQRAATTVFNPYVINLPEGDTIGGWNIDFDGWTGNQKKLHSSQWLSQGYNGILFKGKGVGKSRIRPVADDNFFIGPHNAFVAFEDCTIGVRSFVGKGKAVHMGLANPNGPVLPNFKLYLRNVKLEAEGNYVWALFGYQCDFELVDVVYDPSMAMGYEHGLYAHGFAKEGAYFQNVTMHACGAEGLKFTARPHECRWVPNPVVHIKGCTFKNWYQPWSWRGGAGLVSQGSTAHILIEDTYYYGDATDYNRSKCVMIDGSPGADYNAIDGTIGTGPATGHVVLRRVAMAGADGPDWGATIMRVGNNPSSNPPWCARTLTMDTCGVYGKNRHIQIHGPNGDAFKGPAAITNCNTTQIRDYLFAKGMNTANEAKIDKPGGFVPVSHGILIPRN